jgi:hypothetical protein
MARIELTDSYGDPIEIRSLEGHVSITVTERTRSRGPAEVCFDVAGAVGVAHAILDVAGHAKPSCQPHPEAVEFILHLSNGSKFYTGGFDSIERVWTAIISGRSMRGTFDADAEHEDRWNLVSFDRERGVIAVEDIRA